MFGAQSAQHTVTQIGNPLSTGLPSLSSQQFNPYQVPPSQSYNNLRAATIDQFLPPSNTTAPPPPPPPPVPLNHRRMGLHNLFPLKFNENNLFKNN